MADNPSVDDNNNNNDLADIEALLRDLDVSELDLVEPPADVWAAIERSLAAEATPTTTPGSDDNVVSLADRRRARWIAPALGIAAASVLAVAGIAVFTTRGATEADVIASATLEFDTGFDQLGSNASAHANLVGEGSNYEIELDEATLPDPAAQDADLELWLIAVGDDGGIVDMVSLGTVDDADQTFAVPAGYDPAVYKVVDISVEPHDGNDDHSGRSILRGALTEA